MSIILTNRSIEVKEKIKGAAVKALTAAGLFIVAEAKERVRVDTGNLKGSIVFELLDDGRIGVRVGTNVEYAIYIEKGTGIYAVDGNGRKTPWIYTDEEGNTHRTVGSRPYPFLTPAIEENFEEITRIIVEIMRGDLT